MPEDGAVDGKPPPPRALRSKVNDLVAVAATIIKNNRKTNGALFSSQGIAKANPNPAKNVSKCVSLCAAPWICLWSQL